MGSIPPVDLDIEAPDKEAGNDRNPYKGVDFAEVEAARPLYNHTETWNFVQAPGSGWKPGDGASNDDWKEIPMVSLGPMDPGRESSLLLNCPPKTIFNLTVS